MKMVLHPFYGKDRIGVCRNGKKNNNERLMKLNFINNHIGAGKQPATGLPERVVSGL